MNETIKKDILRVLADTIEAFRSHKYEHLSALSNQVIHNATIYQDEDSIAIAVLIYALGKIAQRYCETGRMCPSFVPQLSKLDSLLVQDKYTAFHKAVKETLNEVETIDRKMRMYIEEVLDKAKLKKGSKLHEHGMSVATAADMLNISQWELMNYVGKTTTPDLRGIHEDARKRYKLARKLFQ